GLTLKPNYPPATFWLVFVDQWDAKSPWHDRRVRLAVNLAIDRAAINQAETLGFSKINHSIIPSSFDFFWQPPAYAYDPARARQLLAAAGYPNGFDAGDYNCDVSYANLAEAVGNYLQAVGLRARPRPLERAALDPIKGAGPPVEESGLTLITNRAYSAPYEDLRLKPR